MLQKHINARVLRELASQLVLALSLLCLCCISVYLQYYDTLSGLQRQIGRISSPRTLEHQGVRSIADAVQMVSTKRDNAAHKLLILSCHGDIEPPQHNGGKELVAATRLPQLLKWGAHYVRT